MIKPTSSRQSRSRVIAYILMTACKRWTHIKPLKAIEGASLAPEKTELHHKMDMQ